MKDFSFVVRIWFPQNWWFQPLNLMFAFFPQNISMFIVGLIIIEELSPKVRMIPDHMIRNNKAHFAWCGDKFLMLRYS